MRIRPSMVVLFSSLTVIMALESISEVRAQNAQLEKLFAALDRPVLVERGINALPLERVLDELRQKHDLEFVIDTEAFERKQNRKDIAKCEVSFEKASGITASLFLDLLLRQMDAGFETRGGKVRIVPATGRHIIYHPAYLPGMEERRTKIMKETLRKQVTLEKGLEEMTFGEAKSYFEDRFDISILVDQARFPKAGRKLVDRSVSLPIMENEPLEQVLKSLTTQLKAAMEIRGGAILIVPREPEI
jgi:hypothetical protein